MILPTKFIMILAAALFWAAGIGIGMYKIVQYQMHPGISAVPPSYINDTTSNQKITLLFFVHPQCPCSKASLNELAKIMMWRKSNLDATAIFLKPENASKDWVESKLYNQAKQIAGLNVIEDKNGTLWKKYHVSTSGQTLLYSEDNRLLFNGGITASRGHEGDNIGSNSIIQYLQKGSIPINHSPVYGCVGMPETGHGETN